MKTTFLTLAAVLTLVFASNAQTKSKTVGAKTNTSTKASVTTPVGGVKSETSVKTNAAATAPATPGQTAPNPNAPDMKFESETHDFGSIKEGVQATWDFKFTNTGKEPLVITNVQAACGCTTPSWPKEPIAPGESGKITAVYNSKGRPNAFAKAVTVYSNAKTATKVLNIKGNVEAEMIATPVQSAPTNTGGPKATPNN